MYSVQRRESGSTAGTPYRRTEDGKSHWDQLHQCPRYMRIARRQDRLERVPGKGRACLLSPSHWRARLRPPADRCCPLCSRVWATPALPWEIARKYDVITPYGGCHCKIQVRSNTEYARRIAVHSPPPTGLFCCSCLPFSGSCLFHVSRSQIRPLTAHCTSIRTN